jgi:hypothetical protein
MRCFKIYLPLSGVNPLLSCPNAFLRFIDFLRVHQGWEFSKPKLQGHRGFSLADRVLSPVVARKYKKLLLTWRAVLNRMVLQADRDVGGIFVRVGPMK